MKEITIDEGEGYFVKATSNSLGAWKVVAIDWTKPEYGYFTDAMLWYTSAHMLNEWIPVCMATWTQKYGTVEAFIEDFPDFKELFEVL